MCPRCPVVKCQFKALKAKPSLAFLTSQSQIAVFHVFSKKCLSADFPGGASSGSRQRQRLDLPEKPKTGNGPSDEVQALIKDRSLIFPDNLVKN